MVEKKTIGGIQLAIGIILLIIGIVGLFLLIPLKNDADWRINSLQQNFQENLRENENASSELKLTAYGIIFGSGYAIENDYNMKKYLLISMSILVTLISLIFITQGALNKSEYQYGKNR